MVGWLVGWSCGAAMWDWMVQYCEVFFVATVSSTEFNKSTDPHERLPTPPSAPVRAAE